MKSICFSLRLWLSAALLLSLAMTSCVDDKCDLSKDVDATIGIGGGVSFPLGSTEKIMLTELIDTATTDILSIDNEGNYSIFKEGSFTPENFEVGNLNINIASTGETRHYDFELFELTDDFDNLPVWAQQEILNSKFPYIVYNEIDYTTNYDIEQSVPEEIKRLRVLDFKNDVPMSIKLKIYSENHQSDDMLELVNSLKLGSENETGFVVSVPDYIVFADEQVNGGRLVLQGNVEYNSATKMLEYEREFMIKGLDFSAYGEGYIPVNDGRIALHDELEAVGFVESDTVFFGYKNIAHIQSVDVEVALSIGEMEIESVEGIFAPEIDPIKEIVDLDLGDDLDFLGDSYLDFNDPRLFVTFSNPVDARLLADAYFVGYDKDGRIIEDSDVAVSLSLEGGENNILFSRYNTQLPGYTTLQVPTLNNLLKTIPDRIDVSVDARMDENRYSTIVLGKSLGISGNYQVSLPLVFDDFKLVYTEEFEDVLGDDPSEITDYVTDVNSVTVNFDVLNTVPAELKPSVVAYDKNGRVLTGVTVDVQGVIAAGNGMDGATVTEPVNSSVAIKMSAVNGELERLYKLGMTFEGSGSGRLNSNEYIQIQNMSITVDDDIVVDLN